MRTLLAACSATALLAAVAMTTPASANATHATVGASAATSQDFSARRYHHRHYYRHYGYYGGYYGAPYYAYAPGPYYYGGPYYYNRAPFPFSLGPFW